MVKVMYNDQLVYKVVILAFFGISLWKEKVALRVRQMIVLGHKPKVSQYTLWTPMPCEN